MKIFSVDGSVLMEMPSIGCSGDGLEFQGLIGGAMPVQGRRAPAQPLAVLP